MGGKVHGELFVVVVVRCCEGRDIGEKRHIIAKIRTRAVGGCSSTRYYDNTLLGMLDLCVSWWYILR